MLAYHVTPAEELDLSLPSYVPAAFAREGFIHATRRREHLHEVANRYYQSDKRPYLVMTIELDRVPSMWRYDAPHDEYPHIYGPIPKEAIVEVAPMPRDSEGKFLPPG